MYPTVATQPATQPRSPQEAISAMIAQLKPVATQRLSLAGARGRVLAESVKSDRPSPAADVSAMDGFAVRMEDLSEGVSLPIACEATMGQRPPQLQPKQAIRIATGAPVPPGADTVIRREDVTEHDRHMTLSLPLPAGVQHGANIRFKGENAPAGQIIAHAGRPITPALTGSLATVGCATPMVYRRVRVSVLVTGDEVLPIDAALTPYQLRDSNGPALVSLLEPMSWIEIVEQQHASDDASSLHETVQRLLEQCDALILTGGVSMGHRDFVPTVLEQAGAKAVFHRVPQRPGKPALGAVGPDGQAILGLPGNPVSVLVTARRLGISVLRHLAGFASPEQPAAVAMEHDDEKQLPLWWHRLVRINDAGRCELIAGRGSGDILAAGSSDGFIEIPPDRTGRGPWPLYKWSD